MCASPTLFSTCMDWILGGCRRDEVTVHRLGMSRSLTLISQMMQSSLWRLDILLGALEVLNEESGPLGLRVSWIKTKIQAFNDILDAAILSVPLFGKDVEVTELLASLTLAMIVMSLLAVSQRSIDVWVGPGKSWIHWMMGCGNATTCAGGRKSGSSGPWCFQSCSTDVRRGL